MVRSPSFFRAAGSLLILEGLLIYIPLIVLGSAIGWPASLGDPPSQVLPAIVEQSTAVTGGYLVYLAYSVLFYPMSLLVVNCLVANPGNTPYLNMAIGFGLASTITRVLGIIRWLVAMPALARVYEDPGSSELTRTVVEVVYQVLNDYAGSIGEVLGVGLFAALWLTIVSAVMWRTGSLPRWIALWGMVAALLQLILLLELTGIDLGGFITLSGVVLHLWFLAAGILLFRKRIPVVV
ncbi:MAG: DUF4386 family protein [Cyanophyceae cyanobacterium]